MRFQAGDPVYHAIRGDAATVVRVFADGAVQVRLAVDPAEWTRSVIGPPSSITEIWDRWLVTHYPPLPEEDDEEQSGQLENSRCQVSR